MRHLMGMHKSAKNPRYDEVTALFIPGFTGQEHARRAVEAGQALLRVTGHAEPGGPWVPVGVGIHTGTA
jgi:adenylate cyclase